MKKRLFTFLISMITSLSLSACANTEKKPETTQKNSTKISEETVDKEIPEEITEEISEEAPEEEISENVNLEHQAPSPEWKNLSITDGAVQIYDIILTTGHPLSELMNIVNTSKVKYRVEYFSGDKNISIGPGGLEMVWFYVGDQSWFTAYVSNPFDGDAVPLDSLPVTQLEVSQEVYEYCYFMDGRSYDEIMQMNYDDVKNLANTVFADDNFRESVRVSEKIVLSEIYTDEELNQRANERTGLCEYSETSDSEKGCTYAMYTTPFATNENFNYSDLAAAGSKPDDPKNYFKHIEVYHFTIDDNTSKVIKFQAHLKQN